MSQTNAQIAARYGFTGTKGGKAERVITTGCIDVIELAKKMEGLIPEGSDKVTIMADLDNVVAHIHIAGGKLTGP